MRKLVIIFFLAIIGITAFRADIGASLLLAKAGEKSSAEAGKAEEILSEKKDLKEEKSPSKLAQISDPMTLEIMHKLVKAVDEDAQINDSLMQLTVEGIKITVVTDPKNNRMRAIAPVKSLDGVDGKNLYRMMQANFDSALDARYAIAQGFVLSVFIHPFKELENRQFLEGIGQVVNLVRTYGTSYTSGAMTFRGGDSQNLHRKLIDELLEKGEEI